MNSECLLSALTNKSWKKNFCSISQLHKQPAFMGQVSRGSEINRWEDLSINANLKLCKEGIQSVITEGKEISGPIFKNARKNDNFTTGKDVLKLPNLLES